MKSATRSAAHAALLIPLAQSLAGLAVAGAVALWAGLAPAAGIATGATVVASGYLVFGWRTVLRNPVVSSARAFARLVLGSVLKWLVIAAGLAWAMSIQGFEPLYVLGGAGLAILAFFLSLSWLLR